MPEGMCSIEILLSSKTCKTFLQKPTSEFIIALSMFIEQKPFLPAIPVMVYVGLLHVLSTIIVPGSSGQLVFLIFIGIPSALTGNMASSCKTLAPIYESSRSSL